MTDRTLSVSITQAGPIALDLTFACAPGEVLGIFGPSGSGKTTILRTIAGLYAPTDAQVRVGSEVWLDTSSRVMTPAHLRAVGFVFQEYALFPHMSALDNVVAALGHMPRRARRRRAAELLELVHLSHQQHRRPALLSGGERQRVALARALARRPAVLLLDEPFAASDRAVRRHLQDEIDDLQRTLDIPLVLVTHDFDDIVRLATHLLILKDGRAVATGPLRDVTSRLDLVWLRDAVGMGAVLEATVTRADPSRGLTELTFDGGALVAPDKSLAVGTRVRVRIPAREVILAGQAPTSLSLHNVLEASVVGVQPVHHTGHVIVQLAVGRERLLAEVTRDAIERLGIVEGRRLHALVKSVSLDIF